MDAPRARSRSEQRSPADERHSLSVATSIANDLSCLADEALRPFDVHPHTGADVDGTTRSAEEHIGELEAIGGRSVIFPLCVTSGYEAENQRVTAAARSDPDRLGALARPDQGGK